MRATPQLELKKNLYRTATKLVNTAFSTRSCTKTKVKCKVKELKARYKVACSLIEKYEWKWNNATTGRLSCSSSQYKS